MFLGTQLRYVFLALLRFFFILKLLLLNPWLLWVRIILLTCNIYYYAVRVEFYNIVSENLQSFLDLFYIIIIYNLPLFSFSRIFLVIFYGENFLTMYLTTETILLHISSRDHL